MTPETFTIDTCPYEHAYVTQLDTVQTDRVVRYVPGCFRHYDAIVTVDGRSYLVLGWWLWSAYRMGLRGDHVLPVMRQWLANALDEQHGRRYDT